MSEQMLHVSVNLTLNESSYGWHSPESQRTIQFSLPADLLHAPLLVKKIETAVKEITAEFPKLKAEYEEELAREEAQKESAEV